MKYHVEYNILERALVPKEMLLHLSHHQLHLKILLLRNGKEYTLRVCLDEREILNYKNFKYFNWNSFIFKILYLNKKKLKLWDERKWMLREEKTWLMWFQIEEYWCGMNNRRGTGTCQCTPPHRPQQHSANDTRHDPDPPRWRVPSSRDM